MPTSDEETEAVAGRGSRKRFIILVVPVIALLAGVGWFFLVKKDASAVPEALPEPEHGEVMALDPITVNLAAAHFLKLGMALQPTATAKEVDGSEALDLAISKFSQMTIAELSTLEGRRKAKEELVARIKLTYLPEGTDLALATGTASAEHEKTASKEPDADAAKEEAQIQELPAEEVIKLAGSLTVQPEIYDLYFTEFVMQ